MAAASETQENSDKKDPVNDTEVSSNDSDKTKLEDLKVVDLKYELEKRDLDKNGVKSVLVERLKAAILEEGGDPEDYNFETSSDSVKNSLKKNLVATNGNVDTSDKLSIHEEKVDVTLQLSIDEEEAQLNEEESLIDIPKDLDNDKEDNTCQIDNDLSSNETKVVSEQNLKETSTSKDSKALSDDTKVKKVVKTTVQNKNNDGSSPSTPKVMKVIGKNDKLKGINVSGAKCLWVTGIPDTTRAADLKTLFSKQGRVLAVKIVKNAKTTPSRCYGFVTMATGKDASKAIQNLHRTELNGRTISVERTQNEPSTLLKKAERLLTVTSKKPMRKEIATPKKAATIENESKSDEVSKKENNVEGSKTSTEETGKKKEEKASSSDKEKSKDKDRKSRERRERETRRPIRRPADYKPRAFGYSERSFRGFRPPFARRPFTSRIGFNSAFNRRPSPIALQKIREGRYERERYRRQEEELRRADEISRHRYIEKKQREEAFRLEREKERLRIERELLERERAEILKLEREKQRLEREKLERERDELRRQAELRSTKRPFSRVEREPEPLWEERKKSARYDERASFHSEAPSSSRFEYPPREHASYNREYERHPDRFSIHKHLETLPRLEFNDHDTHREVTIRAREERHVFSRGDFRDRENRRSFSSRERQLSSRRESAREDWKHDRRVHERIISPSSTSGPRRMAYY